MVSATAAQSIKKSFDQALVANVISRAICVGVSDRSRLWAGKKLAPTRGVGGFAASLQDL
jgi:hypothetical protein